MQGLLSAAAAAYIRLVYRTNRWERVGYEITDHPLADHYRAIVCFWHGRLLMMPYAARGSRPFYIVVSDHRDGRLIARTVRRFGIGAIVGSSFRKPVIALFRMAEICREFGVPCVTPDGPRGPRMRAAIGPVLAAEMAQAVLVPVAYAGAMLVEAVAALVTGFAFDKHGGTVLLTLPPIICFIPGLSLSDTLAPALVGLALWGIATGVQDSTVKALVADLAPAGRTATAYGVFAAWQGGAAVAGGALAGWLFRSPALSVVVVATQVVAFVLLVVVVRRARRPDRLGA